MRKLLAIIGLLVALPCAHVMCQDAKPTTKKAPVELQYEKFVKITVEDTRSIITALERLKELEMYNPKTTSQEKEQNFKNIDQFILSFTNRVKIDSVAVTPKKK